MADWQKKCLDLPARRKNQNLIYTLPTSGGKVSIQISVLPTNFVYEFVCILDISGGNYDVKLFVSSKS